MTIRNLCRLMGRVLGILALILLVPPAMAAFMLYDSARWLFSRPEHPGAKVQRGQVSRPAWRTGASFG